MVTGCDNAEKTIDEVTGNRAVKQYHKTKKDLDQISNTQMERYQKISDEDDDRANQN